MKELNNFIQEKLKVNSSSKVRNKDIIDDIDKEDFRFSEKEIKSVFEFAENLDKIPYAISNKYFDGYDLVTSYSELYIYFSEEYKTKKGVEKSHYSYNHICIWKIQGAWSNTASDVINAICCKKGVSYKVNEPIFDDETNHISNIEDCFTKIEQNLRDIYFFD